VLGGLNRLLVAALVAGAFFVAPSAALACGGGPSAKNVYTECLPTAGGGTPTSGGPAGKASSSAVPISAAAARAIKRAGNDGRVLQTLVRSYGLQRHLASTSRGTAGPPTALGSAFDLGSGPTALLIVLAGTAFLLLGGTGLRIWHRSHRV
jgi:hypothetical protein